MTEPRGPAGIDLSTALGGRRGLIDSGVPGAVFVTVFTLTGQSLMPAVWSAVGAGLLLAAVRLVRREPLTQVVSGLVFVAVAALLAARTGNATNFYLPGLIVQGAYAVAYLASLVVGWPLMGVALGPLLGEGMSWRAVPGRRRAYALSTWLFFATFALRLAVQVPLYLAGAAVALGIVKLVMGWPLFAAAGWLSYQLIRNAPPPEKHLAAGDEPAAQDAGS